MAGWQANKLMHRHLEVLEASQTVMVGTSAPRDLQWDTDVVGTLAPHWVALALHWVSADEHVCRAGASLHSAALMPVSHSERSRWGYSCC